VRQPSCCMCGGSIVILMGHGGSTVRIVSVVLIHVFHKRVGSASVDSSLVTSSYLRILRYSRFRVIWWFLVQLLQLAPSE